jgi:hypothetical protein
MHPSIKIFILLLLFIAPQCERDNSDYDIKNLWKFLYFKEIQSGTIIQIKAFDCLPEIEFFDSTVSLKTPCNVGEGPYFIFDEGKISLNQVIITCRGCYTENADYFENLYKNCFWYIHSYEIKNKMLILTSENFKLYYKLSDK